MFAGGWTFEAAETLSPDLDVFDLLAQLVNKSLVQEEDAHGWARFRFLETVRQYARDRLLESSEVEEIRNRHLDYYLHFIEADKPHHMGANSPSWLEDCEREQDNLRAALQWGLQADPQAALILASALADFWNRHGQFTEAADWLTEALERAESLPPVEGPELQVRQLARARALLAFSQPSMGERTNLDYLEESVHLYRQFGSQAELSLALSMAGLIKSMHKDNLAASQDLIEAIDLGRASGDKFILLFALGVYGGQILSERGELETARKINDEILSLLPQVDNPWATGQIMMFPERYYFIAGEFDKGRKFCQEGVELFRQSGDRFMVTVLYSDLGHIELFSGNLEEAEKIYRQTLPAWHEFNQTGAIAHQLESIGFLNRRLGQFERTARLLGAAEALREAVSSIKMWHEIRIYEREVAELRQQMSPDALEAAWAEGRKLTAEQAIDYALEIEPVASTS